jgi:hypothetical protein
MKYEIRLNSIFLSGLFLTGEPTSKIPTGYILSSLNANEAILPFPNPANKNITSFPSFSLLDDDHLTVEQGPYPLFASSRCRTLFSVK